MVTLENRSERVILEAFLCYLREARAEYNKRFFFSRNLSAKHVEDFRKETAVFREGLKRAAATIGLKQKRIEELWKEAASRKLP